MFSKNLYVNANIFTYLLKKLQSLFIPLYLQMSNQMQLV